MVLSLVSPVGANFIKDWSGQNTINCDLIDAYAGQSVIGFGLTGYTPSLSATTTAPTLGTGGFIRGYYYRIWDQIYSWGEFRFGTTGMNVGNGNYGISLPLAADVGVVGASPNSGSGAAIGNGLLWDASANSGKRPLLVQLKDSVTIEFYHPVGDAGLNHVYSGSPVTWTNGDGISWFVQYKRLP